MSGIKTAREPWQQAMLKSSSAEKSLVMAIIND
jgi:hypothetical protein